jgi:hypothetical protein
MTLRIRRGRRIGRGVQPSGSELVLFGLASAG